MPTMPWATPVPTGPRVARAMKGDMALLILAGTALLFTAVRLASRLPDRGLLAWLLAVGLLAWASAVGSVLLAGTIVRQLTPADLDPVKVWTAAEDRVVRWYNRGVKYYDSLKVVYEIQTRLKEWADEQPGSSQAQPNASPAGETK